MSDQQSKETAKRDRSPKFPYIGLGKALQRVEVLFGKVKRHEARVADIAKDWDLSAKSSSTDRTVAALQAYGLIEDIGSGDARKIKITETGWRILEDVRPGVREKLLAEAAVRPRVIAEYAERWKEGRPDDNHAISQLKFEGGFTDEGARMFLRVFDETIGFVPNAAVEKTSEKGFGEVRQEGAGIPDKEPEQQPFSTPEAASPAGKGKSVEGERELAAGLLSKNASFRILVTGKVGVKEIERLIAKLELDKEIFSEQDPGGEDAAQ